MDSRLRMLVAAVAVCALAPARAHAQQASQASHDSLASQTYQVSQDLQASPTSPASRASAAGPRLELTATAVRRPAVTDSASVSTLLARRQSMGQPVALMIVGGAAFLVGAVIGGDAGTIFMIGGAVAGLIGLYQYLQ